MVGRIDLPNIDPAVGVKKSRDELSFDKQADDKLFFAEEFYIWLSNIVDVLNIAIDTIENAFAFMMAVGTATITGPGVGPYTILVTNLPATGFVTAQIISSTNQTTISRIVVSAGQFTVTFSSDPGTSAIIKYVAYTAKP